MDGLYLQFRFHYRGTPKQAFNVSFEEDDTEALIKWLSHHSGTGRNALCPCHSGRKFKICCSRNKPLIQDWDEVRHNLRITPSELDLISDIGRQTGNELINDFIDAVAVNPSLLQDSEFWNDLGENVGVLKYGEQAIYCFTMALELDPTNHAARLDLAATLSWSRGKHDDALMLMNEVPDNYKRRLVIEANILNAKGDPESAIPLYERAIFEEPDFALPYGQLLGILEEPEHPLYSYWIDQAARMLPTSPVIAGHYARNLWGERKLEELAQSAWIDEVDTKVDEFLIGRPDYSSIATEASVFRQLAQVLLNPNPDMAKALGYRILDIDPEIHLCVPANYSSIICAQLGIIELIQPLYGRVCDLCIETGKNGIPKSVDTLLAVGHMVLGNLTEAIAHCEKVLEKYPDTDECLQQYYWALDDIGRTEEAIDIAKRIFDIDPTWNHISHNLGAMTQKAGRLGEARYYYELQLDNENHIRAQKALVLLELIEKRFEESAGRFEQWCSMMRHPVGSDNLEQVERELYGLNNPELQTGLSTPDWSESIDAKIDVQRNVFEELLSFCESNSSSITFASDVIEKNTTYGNLMFGPESTLKPETLSVDHLFENTISATQANIHQIKFLLQLEQRGDFSITRSSLIRLLPRFDKLPQEAKSSLLEGERRFMSDTPMADYSTVAVSFAKAVEICLLQTVFTPYKSVYEVLRITHGQSDIYEIGSQSQAASLFKFIEKGHYLELGSMAHIFRLCNGRTSEKEFIVGQLRDFVRLQLNGYGLLDAQTVENIGSIANDFRNPGAHSKILTREQSEECRILCLSVLHQIEICLDISA
jgi:tetratricopeptide (TPR) repeat protein